MWFELIVAVVRIFIVGGWKVCAMWMKKKRMFESFVVKIRQMQEVRI